MKIVAIDCLILVVPDRQSIRQRTHAHAHLHLTADNHNVIYNAPTLARDKQVCAARLPDGYLEPLE